MKFTIVAALALAGFAAAEIESKPFHLVLSSSNKSLDGKKLESCHEGAAIESLCISTVGDKYYLNTTKGEETSIKGYSVDGSLSYSLPINGGGGQYISEPMSFYADPSTNVGLPLFSPGYDITYVAFDDETGEMVVFSYLNDTVNPATDDKPRALSRWYACKYNYSAYVYEVLTWVYGIAEPENPTCSKVTVKRVFL